MVGKWSGVFPSGGFQHRNAMEDGCRFELGGCFAASCGGGRVVAIAKECGAAGTWLFRLAS